MTNNERGSGPNPRRVSKETGGRPAIFRSKTKAFFMVEMKWKERFVLTERHFEILQSCIESILQADSLNITTTTCLPDNPQIKVSYK